MRVKRKKGGRGVEKINKKFLDSRDMVLAILQAGQWRCRCKDQTFGLSGRSGWDG